MKTWFVVLVLALPLFAEDQATSARMAAGCGPSDAQFKVKTDKHQHPIGQPEMGKALVYFFSDTDVDNVSLRVGGLVTRVGVDGAWVGANNFRSYFFFSVDPGEHRLCTSQQSKSESVRSRTSAALSFTAEAGKVYYFRTRTPERPVEHETVELRSVDPAQAQLLIASSPFSAFHREK